MSHGLLCLWDLGGSLAGRGPSRQEVHGAASCRGCPPVSDAACGILQNGGSSSRVIHGRAGQSLLENAHRLHLGQKTVLSPASHRPAWSAEPHLPPAVPRGRRWYPVCSALP